MIAGRNDIYRYTVVQAVNDPNTCIEKPTLDEHAIMVDAGIIADRIGNAETRLEMAKVCRFIARVKADRPLFFGKKHHQEGVERSIVILPEEKVKKVFVSLRQRVSDSKGWQNFRQKEIVMLKFDSSTNRLLEVPDAVERIVKFVTAFSDQPREQEDVLKKTAAQRRISIMQLLDGLKEPLFPTIFGYVTVEGKSGKKLCIFQERPTCDLHALDKKRNTPIRNLQLEVKKDLIRSVASTLLKLGDNGIYHRSLNPKKILVFEQVSPNGEKTYRFKLSDFGYACKSEDVQERNKPCGLPWFLAPEILLAKSEETAFEYGHSQELWSLGLLIHFLFNRDPHPVQNALGEDLEFFDTKLHLNVVLTSLPRYPKQVITLEHLRNALLQPHPDKRISLSELIQVLPDLKDVECVEKSNSNKCTIC